jgi:hypothetical protein
MRLPGTAQIKRMLPSGSTIRIQTVESACCLNVSFWRDMISA